MALILTVVLIVCMLLALFAALPFPAAAPYSWGFPILIWISVAILCYLVVGGGEIGVRRVGSLLRPLLSLAT